MTLAESRGLVSFYARRVVSAMARRFPAGGEHGWQMVVEGAIKHPYGEQADALKLYQERIADIGDWAAIDRLLFHADKVWEAECDRMMDLPYARRRVA